MRPLERGGDGRVIDISTYLNRITSEHKTQPKFMGLVEARLQPFIDLFECLEDVDKAFDLDTATGKQLDIIGEYIGVKRLLNFQPEYAGAVLTDPYYRMLLKARISLNNWDGTIEGIKRIWGDIFPEYEIQIVDRQDMTMEARIIGLRALFESELVQHGYITPKPMGVNVDYTVVMSIEVDAGLFIAAMNTNRAGKTELPPPEPPSDNTKPGGTVYTGGGRTDTSLKSGITGKVPPADIQPRSGRVFVSIFKSADMRSSERSDKSPSEQINIPLARACSVSGAVTTIVKQSDIRR